jgi:hypothetical protein
MRVKLRHAEWGYHTPQQGLTGATGPVNERRLALLVMSRRPAAWRRVAFFTLASINASTHPSTSAEVSQDSTYECDSPSTWGASRAGQPSELTMHPRRVSRSASGRRQNKSPAR